MWVTTKSIVKEIRHEQEKLMTKIEAITFAQIELKEELQNKIEVLIDRITGIEAELLETKTEDINQQMELLSQLTEIQKQLTSSSENIASSYNNCISSINDEIERNAMNNAQGIINKINTSVERIIQTAEDSIQQSKERLLCDIGKVVESEQSISSRVEVLCSQNESVENNLNTVSKSINHSIVEKSDKISEEIKKIRMEFESFSTAAKKDDMIFTENIETMNAAMQEITRNLLSLDEGNRLIIARLLLKDLEG